MADVLVLRFRGLQVDVPRSTGFYGGIAAAVATGLIEPPLGVIIAAVPLAKMALNSRAPAPLRWLGQIVDGAVKPVAGDGQGTIRLADPQESMSSAAQTTAMAARAPARVKSKARRDAASDAGEAISGE